MTSPNLATIKFGANNSAPANVSINHPYYKYTWTATFELGEVKADDLAEQQPGGETATSIADVTLKTFELPRWTTETQIVNQYNHKTIVQTKLNYEPITISFYDQQNDAVDKLIWDFVKGQFDPNDASKKASIRPMTVVVKMHRNSAGVLDSEPKTYTLGNAYIVDAQHDTLDYSTSDVVLWTITIRYETLETKDFKGKPPGQAVGIAAKKEEAKPEAKPEAVATKPAPAATPPIEPIPDASPSLLDLELGITGPINYNPTGLSQVLDQQRSRDKPKKEKSPPGPLSGDGYGYTGYESAFIGTVPGLNGADVGSPSTGAIGAGSNSNNNQVNRSTATANRDARNNREGNTQRITETRELPPRRRWEGSPEEFDKRMADSRARRLGYTDDAAYQRAQDRKPQAPVMGNPPKRIGRDIY